MKEALGLVEIKGLATAILVADAMAKTANVTITQLENTKGLGWMTIKITGDVGAVNAAVNAGRQIGLEYNHFIASKVIPRPSYSVEKAFCQKQEQKQPEKIVKEIKEPVELITEKTTEVIELISQETTEIVKLTTEETINPTIEEENSNNENSDDKPKKNTGKSSRRKNKNTDDEEK